MIFPSHVVAIPFVNRLESVARCASLILAQALPETRLLLVDDGSQPRAAEAEAIRQLLTDSRVHLIQHPENKGISAARNSALHWSRKQGVEVLLMLDSDCEPQPRLLRTHLELMASHPDVACLGGAMVGHGRTLLASLDGTLSWALYYPRGQTRERRGTLYHLSTANMSLRLALLPQRDFLFDETLSSNEDYLLMRLLQDAGRRILFTPDAIVRHADRETLADVLEHHSEWGRSNYFVQLGGGGGPRLLDRRYRALFIAGFALHLPLYAIAGSSLSLLPWLRAKPSALAALPPAILVWMVRGVAVLQTALSPEEYLRDQRPHIEYEEERRRCA